MNAIAVRIRQTLEAYYSPQEAAWLSRIVCCEMLGLSVTDYFAGKDRTLSANEEQVVDGILKRLCKFEPIQYIQGFTNFCGRPFRVSPDVLIPRPETEELVEMIAKCATPAARMLDIGTGSGCIAITLSKECPDAHVDAWDISTRALDIAQTNNERLQGSVHFEQHDVLAYRPETAARYDIIVSNPPYVREAERQNMDRNVLDWEPPLALYVPDNDPLLFYRHIGRLAQDLLVPGGSLYLEINQALGKETTTLLNTLGYTKTTIRKDLSGNDRFVIAEK